jgi:hypothetical protein
MYLEKSVYVLVVDNNLEQLFMGETPDEAKSAFEDYINENLSQFIPMGAEQFVDASYEEGNRGALWVVYVDGDDVSQDEQFEYYITSKDIITINN